MADDFENERRGGAESDEVRLRGASGAPNAGHRLSDGREDLGNAMEHGATPDERSVGGAFERSESVDDRRLGEAFADVDAADRYALGQSFADPNSRDDIKLGKSFEETEGKGKPKTKLKDKVHAPKQTHVLKWLVLGVVVVFLLLFFIGWLPRHQREKQTQQMADQRRNAVPQVQVLTVQNSTAHTSGLVLPGTTAPLTEASVYARANGYLRARYVDIGDHVRKGQVLAIIDAPDLDAQVAQAREQLRQAEMQVAQQQAQLDLARVTWERYRVLVAKGVFSRQDGDQQDVNYRAQQANVSAASRNVDAYKANLQRVIALADYEKVRAPFDGVVTARNVDVGALIQTSGAAGTPAMASNAAGSIMSGGQTQAGMSNTAGATGSGPTAATPQNSGSQGGPLFSIAQMQTLRVLVSAPEGYVGSVQRGTPAELHFQEFPQQTFFGKVTRNAGSLDQNTRTLLTEVDIDNHDGKLLPGMYAVVTFSQKDVAAHESGGGALLIPGDAIVIRQDQPEVALVRDGVVHLQPVVIGRDYGASTEITDGLRPGDTLVIDVTDDVVEGAHVKAQPSKSAAQTVNPQAGPQQNTAPPGGSTQYGNPAITNANMMGQQGKQGKKGKQGKGGTKGAEGSGTSKP